MVGRGQSSSSSSKACLSLAIIIAAGRVIKSHKCNGDISGSFVSYLKLLLKRYEGFPKAYVAECRYTRLYTRLYTVFIEAEPVAPVVTKFCKLHKMVNP